MSGNGCREFGVLGFVSSHCEVKGLLRCIGFEVQW